LLMQSEHKLTMGRFAGAILVQTRTLRLAFTGYAAKAIPAVREGRKKLEMAEGAARA
jgi:hypothetical protein